MAKGVQVLAAAAGTVLRLRDGMDDVSIRVTGADAVKDREAGNSLIIDHGNGWETQYGHLRKGSIIVKPGQTVTAGQPIALMGLSGNTEFTHTHFEVRHNGKPVDPYTGADMGSGLRRRHAAVDASGRSPPSPIARMRRSMPASPTPGRTSGSRAPAATPASA